MYDKYVFDKNSIFVKVVSSKMQSQQHDGREKFMCTCRYGSRAQWTILGPEY
jgi:hypothetical protein